MTRFLTLLLVFSTLILSTGCGGDDDPEVENEEEVITSVTLTLFPDNTSQDVVTFGFLDADGDGGLPPVTIVDGDLVANSVYTGMVSFGGPDGSIDGEIVEEGEEHQVFYTNTGLNLTFNYRDQDDAGQPIGLSTQVLTGDASQGTLTVILRHEPNKSVMALPDNPDAAGGSTDAEVNFNVTIQ